MRHTVARRQGIFDIMARVATLGANTVKPCVALSADDAPISQAMATASCTYGILPSYAAAHTLSSNSRKGEPMPSKSSGAIMAKTGTSPLPTTAGTFPSETMQP